MPDDPLRYSDPALIQAAALGAGGKYLAAASGFGDIYIFDTGTQQVINVLSGHEQAGTDGWSGAVQSLAFSPQSNLLVSVGYDDTIRLWNIFSGGEIRRLNGCCFADFTPDGRYLITAGEGVVRVWGIP